MRYTIGVLTVCLLAGCSGTPPKPPLPQGDYRPVNAPPIAKKATIQRPDWQAGHFDFIYEGDITGALPALKEQAPEIKVMPTVGKAIPVPVRISLHGATLEAALRAIGEQGVQAAELVWNTTRNKGSNQVFIRFRAQSENVTEGSHE